MLACCYTRHKALAENQALAQSLPAAATLVLTTTAPTLHDSAKKSDVTEALDYEAFIDPIGEASNAVPPHDDKVCTFRSLYRVQLHIDWIT